MKDEVQETLQQREVDEKANFEDLMMLTKNKLRNKYNLRYLEDVTCDDRLQSKRLTAMTSKRSCRPMQTISLPKLVPLKKYQNV